MKTSLARTHMGISWCNALCIQVAGVHTICVTSARKCAHGIIMREIHRHILLSALQSFILVLCTTYFSSLHTYVYSQSQATRNNVVSTFFLNVFAFLPRRCSHLCLWYLIPVSNPLQDNPRIASLKHNGKRVPFLDTSLRFVFFFYWYYNNVTSCWMRKLDVE